jgi:hypothetical protein
METLHGPISSFSFVPKFVLTDLVSHILGREYNSPEDMPCETITTWKMLRRCYQITNSLR